MTILVTGAAGFIGAYLLQHFTPGETIVGLDQKSLPPWLYGDHIDYRRISGIFNIADQREHTNRFIAETIIEAVHGCPRTDLLELSPESGGSMRVAMDCRKADLILGWEPTIDIAMGLKTTVACALSERNSDESRRDEDPGRPAAEA